MGITGDGGLVTFYMLHDLEFEIPVTPVAKARPRFTRSGHTYTPQKTKDAEEEIAWHVKRLYRHEPIKGPISLKIIFYMKPPKSSKVRDGDPHTKRPDLDNLIKILDGLRGVLFEDDSQIWRIFAKKVYRKEPGILLTVADFIE